jgi:protein TonB
MERHTISVPRFEVGWRRRPPMAPRRRRFLLIAVALSVGMHLAAALLVVLLPRILSNEASPQEPGTVELLMVEQKGAEPSTAGQPKDATSAPAPAKPEAAEPPPPRLVPSEKADAPKGEDPKDAPATTPLQDASSPPPPDQGDEPVPPPARQTAPKSAETDAQPAEKRVEIQPKPPRSQDKSMPPRSQEAPVFDLAGTESESNAIVLGGRVLPAMRDDRFRNRPPLYPVEAEIRGEHGAVVVVIHVSENGLAAGADVLESSGFDILDQAAITAVRKWHFRPALKEGRAIPFDMQFRFIFQPF